MLESLFFVSKVFRHHYIKDKKALPDWEGFTYNLGNPITCPCNP